MDPLLADKIAYFQRLNAMQGEDDGDDAYDVEEQTHRETSKKFHAGASASTKSGFRAASIENTRKTRAASQESPKPRDTPADNDVEIIKVTPRQMNPPRGKTPKAGESHGVDEDVIPDSTRASEKKPLPASLHQLLRHRITRQSSSLSNAPSPLTIKRKKEAKLKVVPEDQQIFKGLQFYYIPNDNTNAVRKHQINKAKEHGAEWVRTLKEASHIIVDQNLTYKDIESELATDPLALTKTMVGANYPTGCVGHKTLLNPNQGKYTQNLKASEETSGKDSSGAEPASLQTSRNTRKQRRSLRKGQESPTSSQSGNEQPDTELNALARKAPAVVANDELSQYIALVRGNSVYQQVPLEEEEDEASRNNDLEEDMAEPEHESSDDDRAKKKRKTGKQTQKDQEFACMKGGAQGGDPNNPNARTIEFLQEMADRYERQDHWRCFSYRKAITTLKRQETKITTAEEAIKLPNIGESLASKIEEIVTDDRLRKLENEKKQPEDIIKIMFLKIYGVGITQANRWVSQGYRTLEDLKEKAKLSPSQQIGIDHYYDLNERIPRWEVKALADVVIKTGAAIDASVEFIIGGSYRRGSDSSGDLDLIITRKQTKTVQELAHFLEKLVGRLSSDGFLTAALASFSGHTGRGHGSKWHGCCVLPEADFPNEKGQYRPIWRRIDLLLVPESEFGAALIYFTGNDIFNRSMRALAGKKGMRLNQRGLYKDVLRGPGGVKYSEGKLLEGRDEKKIFELLGVTWREPYERWC